MSRFPPEVRREGASAGCGAVRADSHVGPLAHFDLGADALCLVFVVELELTNLASQQRQASMRSPCTCDLQSPPRAHLDRDGLLGGAEAAQEHLQPN